MNYTLSLEERETIITFNEADKECYVDSCNRYILSRCEEAMKRYPDKVQMVHSDKYGKRYILPKNFIRLNPPKKRNMTDKEKAAFVDRVKATRKHSQVAP